MPRAHRILASALFFSLAVHLLMLASTGVWWTPPIEEIPFPIEASLAMPEPRVEVAAPVAKPKPERTRPVTPAPVEPLAPAPPEAALPPAFPPEPTPPAVMAPPTPVAEPTPPAPVPAPAPVPVPESIVAEPALPPSLRKLPARLNLSYTVRAGEGGFNLGRAIYSWQQRDGRYTLVSVAEATGLASLFVSGRLVQTSEGSITPHGLRPEQYWLSRNERKQDVARFDWVQERLVQGSDGVELPPGSQDVLSFPFHLAMTVDDSAREWTLWVSNGRKLRDYLFRNLGRERLTLHEGEIETLHLQGRRDGEGTLDVWLVPSRHWLPLRIRTLDQKGKVLLLSLEEAP